MELNKEFREINCNEMREKINESFDIDYQLNLPQYLDDIDKLIKCCVKNVVTDYDLSSSSIIVYGKSIITIMYKTEDNMTLSNIYEEEFSRTFDITDCNYPDFAQVNLCTAYSNSRLVNQRRIDVHTSLNAQINIFCKKNIHYLSNCENAFLKSINTDILNVKACCVCSVEFDEAFSLTKGESQIKNIINTYVNSVVSDKKIIKDKMLVKIDNEISVVYCDENSNIDKIKHTFSISRIIDINGCDENDYSLIDAKLCQLYVKPKADTNNQLCDIEAVGRIAISYKICSIEKENISVDSYIPHYKAVSTNEKFTLKSNPAYYFDTKSFEMTFENEKSIIEIVDLNAQVTRAFISSSTLNCAVLLRFFYHDEEGILCYFEKEEMYTLKLNSVELFGEASVNLLSYDFVINNTNKVNLRLNIEYSAFLYKESTIEYIADINAEEKIENSNACELTLYFARENESVWDIAKTFSTDSRLIIEENDLTSDIIDTRRVLLVPGMWGKNICIMTFTAIFQKEQAAIFT